MYFKIVNNEPSGFAITEENLRQVYPSVELEQEMFDSKMLELGFAKFLTSEAPKIQFPLIAEDKLIFDGINVRINWSVRMLSLEEQKVIINKLREECDVARETCLSCSSPENHNKSIQELL